jgi:formate hydrogenlyase subunit 6/NADH:ubiquinone oxidoreductase subunit I
MFDMISNIIKNLVNGPSTRLYPIQKRQPFANGRGQIKDIDAELCVYCGMCQRRCPANCITVDRLSKTWTLNPYKCIICGVCVEACPKKCINMDNQYRIPSYKKDPLVIAQPKEPAVDEEQII